MIGALTAKPNLILSEDAKRQLTAILRQFDSLIVSDDMGGAGFASEQNLIGTPFTSIGPMKEKSYVLRFDEFVRKASDAGANLIVTVGGDGIASYVATAIIRQNLGLGILAFPAGTANVGPIVRPDHDSTSLVRSRRLDSIEVSCAGKILGYGFNDVILGRSFLGTVGGKWANLCARSMSERGEAIECQMTDEDVAAKAFSVYLNGQKMENPSFHVRQICISTLHQDNLFGRAVIGGLTEANNFSHPAAIALMDKVYNDARPETWGKKEFRLSSHLCFDAGDVIEIEGLADGVCVIIDGNPFVMKENRLMLRCVPDSVLVFGIGR